MQFAAIAHHSYRLRFTFAYETNIMNLAMDNATLLLKTPPLEPDPKPEPKPDPEREPGADPDLVPAMDPEPEPLPM